MTASYDDRIPLWLLTGFLGSGKTTLLNHLLKDPALAGTAVIINEFGTVGLDHELVESASEEMVLLQSGCLCCTIRGDLLTTLDTLFGRRERGELGFDRIIVETTGLADPSPILHTLIGADSIAARFRLDSVVTTVDAALGNRTLDRQPEALRQVAVADVLIMTKLDLADPSDAAVLEARLRRLNPGAMLRHAEHGAVPAMVILQASPYGANGKSLDVVRWLNAEAHLAADGGHHDHHHHHDTNRHGEDIRSTCLILDEPIEGAALYRWLEGLTALRGPDLLRVKGIVNVIGMEGPLVIHGVQHLFHTPVRMKRWPSRDRRSRIVFIARNIEQAAFRDTLRLFSTVA